MINPERLAETFVSLVKIDSVSRNEKKVRIAIQEELKSLGAETIVDGSEKATGSNTGNLIARFRGTGKAKKPILLAAHMDTVDPGKGIQPVLNNGIFTSRGDTILGADDKSAIAIILEVLHVMKERNLPHGPLEIVFSVCEEIGLLGAKHLDYGQLLATYGYTLDARDTEGIITRAPAANHIRFNVKGRAAHAGANPELGINAIALAGKALGRLTLGRIDYETTCNIGKIEGGRATNIVPDRVHIHGEVRSHNTEKLEKWTNELIETFEETVQEYGIDPKDGLPCLDVHVEQQYPATNVPESHLVVETAKKAANRIGREMKVKATGGGSDSNIFFEHGIVTGVLGTGMDKVHTENETVSIDDMVQACALLLEIINIHSETDG